MADSYAKWGILVSTFYALILLVFIVPGAIYAGGDASRGRREYLNNLHRAYSDWFLWLLIAIMLTSQFLLLFLSVDTSQKATQTSRTYFDFHRTRCAPNGHSHFWRSFVIRFRNTWGQTLRPHRSFLKKLARFS